MADTRCLVLEDGTVFYGTGFGAHGDAYGEVVFNTALTGVVEVMSDPSYVGQLVVMAAPEIGTYGVCTRDMESDRIWATGLVVKNRTDVPSNFRSEMPLAAWLEAHDTSGLAGLDTRAVVRLLRDRGVMRGAVVGLAPGDDELQLREVLHKVRASAHMAGRALAKEVSVTAPVAFTDGLIDMDGAPVPVKATPRHRVVAIDLGMKKSIGRLLVHHGCSVTVVPYDTTAADILAHRPDGVFISNGPGDPAAAGDVVKTVDELLGTLPIFGICMGHQVLARAMGADTFKTRFGHRGNNQPVSVPGSGQVWITSQNHGFAAHPDALMRDGVELSVNISDGTVEGFCVADQHILSAQYHPEAAPGPHDARPLFDTFTAMMDAHKATASGRTSDTTEHRR